jgi:hypothetical protein
VTDSLQRSATLVRDDLVALRLEESDPGLDFGLVEPNDLVMGVVVNAERRAERE